ncbi:MAG: hypothetical protein ACP5K3_00910 [Candidatus Micrarchaeia archaeon]
MGARNALLAAVLFFTSYSLAFSADQTLSDLVCSSSSNLPASLSLSPLFSVIALALMISFLVVSIGVMISRVVPGTKLEGWLKNEYWEIAKSAMLVAGALGFMIFIGNISLLLINQSPVTTPGISGANEILNSLSSSASGALCTIYDDISDYSTNTFALLAGIAIWKQMQFGWYIPLPLFAFAFTFGSIFNPYVNSMLETTAITAQYESFINDTINILYLPVIIMIAFLSVVMPSVIYLGFMVLIPLGIIFRSFPFLRPVGGSLFAFGVGLSIVLPVLIILINMPITSIIYEVVGGGSTSATSSLTGILSGVLSVLLNTLLSTLNFAGIGYLGVSASSTVSIYPALNTVVPFFVLLFTQVLLLIIDLMIWFPLVDSIAKALGGTIRLSLGGKLKIG